jgi:ACT domain-containing protein
MTDKSGAIVIQRIALEDLQQTVERLQRENERLIQQHDNDMHTIEVGSHANAELHVENERLRAALQEVVAISSISQLPDRIMEIVTNALDECR